MYDYKFLIFFHFHLFLFFLFSSFSSSPPPHTVTNYTLLPLRSPFLIYPLFFPSFPSPLSPSGEKLRKQGGGIGGRDWGSGMEEGVFFHQNSSPFFASPPLPSSRTLLLLKKKKKKNSKEARAIENETVHRRDEGRNLYSLARTRCFGS